MKSNSFFILIICFFSSIQVNGQQDIFHATYDCCDGFGKYLYVNQTSRLHVPTDNTEDTILWKISSGSLIPDTKELIKSNP